MHLLLACSAHKRLWHTFVRRSSVLPFLPPSRRTAFARRKRSALLRFALGVENGLNEGTLNVQGCRYGSFSFCAHRSVLGHTSGGGGTHENRGTIMRGGGSPPQISSNMFLKAINTKLHNHSFVVHAPSKYPFGSFKYLTCTLCCLVSWGGGRKKSGCSSSVMLTL